MNQTKQVILCFLILALTGLSACTTSYQAARKSFYGANRVYLKPDPEDALIRYCQSLNQIETGLDKDPASRLLKAVIYHRLYLMEARSVYRKSSQKQKDQYAAFSTLLSGSDNTEFLNLAFSEILSAESEIKNTDLKKLDPFLLIHKDLILADKLSDTLDRETKTLTATRQAMPIEFIRTVNSYGYEELIKSLYLSAWAEALIQNQKSADNDPAQPTNEIIYQLSLNRLKYIYYSLRNTTARLQSPAGLARSNHYHEVVNKIERIMLGSGISALTTASAEQVTSDLLDETIGKNHFILDPEAQLNEARDQMNLGIEMIVTDKPDKAETHLLYALKNIIAARELSADLSEADRRLIDATRNDIYANLYRISDQLIRTAPAH